MIRQPSFALSASPPSPASAKRVINISFPLLLRPNPVFLINSPKELRSVGISLASRARLSLQPASMTRQNKYPRRLGRQHSRSRIPRRLQDRESRYQSSHSRRELNFTPSPSISPRRSFRNIEEPESPPIYHQSTSPAPRRLSHTSVRYFPLNQERKEIRLLRILPQATSIIKCELFHTSLSDPCRYIALSYAWGDKYDTGTIMIDGREVEVTESLMLALEGLRSRHDPVIVWADAICIDQENTQERNLQVQAMTSIYQKAAKEAIWLGPEAQSSNMAFELLNTLYQNHDSPAHIRTIISSPDSRAAFLALVALFDRDYWSRLWVVQEVINGNNKTVYCGTSSLPWEICRIASDVLLEYCSDLTDAFMHVTGAAAISASGYTCTHQLVCGGPAVLHDLRDDRGEADLLKVLFYHQRKYCTDPRDRIYGLLGALSPSKRLDFPVDYSIPVRELYIDVVGNLLTTTQSFDVICASINFPVHQNLHGLPSWCPDWSQRRRILPIWHDFRGFSAAGASKARVAFCKGSKRRTLEVSAILLDKITSCGMTLNTPVDKNSMLMVFYQWWCKLIHTNGYKQEDHEAFCRTISCGQVPDTWTPREWLERTYRTFASGLLGRCPEMPLHSHLMSYVQNFAPLSPAEQKQTLDEDFTNAMTGRCFATTHSGLLCLGSGALQAEDLVCVPLGSSTPIILRKRGDRYTFIGDIYVDGYMDGKAIDDWRNGMREVETFAIK